MIILGEYDLPPNPVRETRRGITLRLRLIGQMQARTADDVTVLPLGRKTRALLAILALAAPRSIIRSRLAELLWSRRLEEQARASLRQEIHRLLEALQPLGTDILRVTRDHLSLRSDLIWVDVNEVLHATVADPGPLSLLKGELLEEFEGVDPALDGWLSTERERLRDHARAVAEALLEKQATPETVIPLAHQLLGIDRAHEGAWRALIRAHAERGERGLAIQAYERCRSALADRLDAAPSHETQSLVAKIRSGTLSSEMSLAPKPDPVRSGLAAGDRQSVTVGVLPLQMAGLGSSDTQLGLRLAGEVAAALAHFNWLSLMPSSSLVQNGQDKAELRQQFGLDFLLDGTVQVSAGSVRASVWLMDLRDQNRIVWTRRFDWENGELRDLQDEMVAAIVGQLGPEIQMAESRRAALKPAEASTAYDLVLRAIPMTVRLRRDEFNQAELLLKRALELQPDYAPAHISLAHHLTFRLGQGWTTNEAETIAESGRHASRAILLDSQNARSFAIAGHIRAYLDQRPREAVELHARALSLNPNLAMAWGLSAATYIYLGELDEAARRFARYQLLSPNHPHAFFFDAGMALLALQQHDYAAAITYGRRGCELNPNFCSGLLHYLAALGHAGQVEEATRVRVRLLSINPTKTVQQALSRSGFELQASRQHYAEGLRLGGLPEGDRPAPTTAEW